MLGRYRGPLARATGAPAPVARGGERSEAITRAQLQPPGAVGDAEGSVAAPAAEVLVVEHVEHLERQVRSLRPPRGQLLPEPHVYVPERKRVPKNEVLLRGERSVLRTSRLIWHSRAEREQPAELDAERHVHDPVPHHGVALHVWGRVAGVIGREPEVEAEQVAADLGALGPGIRESRAPVRRR